MKKWGVVFCTILVMGMTMACGPSLPEKLEIPLTPVKGYEGDAKGTMVIDTKTGTDVHISITGLKPDGLYTAYFVNIKSQMFEGIGEEPWVLPVAADGTVDFQGNIEKNVFLRFTKVGIFLNPGDTPIRNPLGVKATLGALIKTQLPKMILEGKLR